MAPRAAPFLARGAVIGVVVPPTPESGPAPATILLVQDNPADVYSTGRILADAYDPPPSIISVPTVDAASIHLRDH